MIDKCYSCAHRRDFPGSCHSSCQHPATARAHLTGEAETARLLGKRSGYTSLPLDRQAADLRVTGAPIGVRNGWFLWPVNFDPVWLESCDGFTPVGAALAAESEAR